MRFHHIGVACRELSHEASAHALLGFVPEGPVFTDPQQQVRGQFWLHQGFRIEILEPLHAQSPLEAYLQRGIKMYHQAYEVDDLATAMDHLSAQGAHLCAPPSPAVAFAGRRIVFLLLRSEMLIELIEAHS